MHFYAIFLAYVQFLLYLCTLFRVLRIKGVQKSIIVNNKIN